MQRNRFLHWNKLGWKHGKASRALEEEFGRKRSPLSLRLVLHHYNRGMFKKRGIDAKPVAPATQVREESTAE